MISLLSGVLVWRVPDTESSWFSFDLAGHLGVGAYARRSVLGWRTPFGGRPFLSQTKQVPTRTILSALMVGSCLPKGIIAGCSAVKLPLRHLELIMKEGQLISVGGG